MRARWGTMAVAVAAVVLGCGPMTGTDGGVDAGRIVAVAAMPEPRAGAVAFALPGDRVLVAAGVRDFDRWYQLDGGAGTVSELFDLATLSWATTPGLTIPRYMPQGVVLASGQPLLLGGVLRALGTVTATVEVYSLDAGTWSVQGHLTTPREYSSATLLGSGLVLVAGGHASDAADAGPLASAELYDPATGVSIPTGALQVARGGHAAALGAGGRVLVVGGGTNGDWSDTTASVEIYQPDAGTWLLAQPLPGRLELTTATALATGEVLVAGGCLDDASPCGPEMYRAHLYDLQTGTRTDLPNMPSKHAGGAAVRLPSGRILVVGGDNPQQGMVSGSLYLPEQGRWVPVASAIRTGLFSAVACLPDGRVLVAGGKVWDDATSTTWATDAAELYQP